jgi:hypothetical protein
VTFTRKKIAAWPVLLCAARSRLLSLAGLSQSWAKAQRLRQSTEGYRRLRPVLFERKEIKD